MENQMEIVIIGLIVFRVQRFKGLGLGIRVFGAGFSWAHGSSKPSTKASSICSREEAPASPEHVSKVRSMGPYYRP